jgi:hypothetical protein
MKLAKSNEIVSGKEFIFVTKDVMSGELVCSCKCKPYNIVIKDGDIRWSTDDGYHEIPYNNELVNRIQGSIAEYDVTVYHVD